MRKGTFNKKMKFILLSLCLSMILVACNGNDNVEKEEDNKVTDQIETKNDQKEDPQNDASDNNSEEVESDNTEATEAPTPTAEAEESSIFKDFTKEADIDENGVTDVLKVTHNLDENYSLIQVNLNDNLIFEYKTDDLLIIDINEFEYVDLDQDGTEEIFIASFMNTNTRPLTEVLVIKDDSGVWKQLLLPTNGNGYNAFMFDIKRGAEEFDFVISSSEYLKKDIHFDARGFYRDDEAGGIDTVKDYRNLNYQEGDRVGNISAWGLHEAKVGRYDGQNCIIGLHGIEAQYGHFIGYLYIYFNFDENGSVKVLNVEYQPELKE